MSEPSDPASNPTPPSSLGDRELDVDVTAFLPEPEPEPEPARESTPVPEHEAGADAAPGTETVAAPGVPVETASAGEALEGQPLDAARLSEELDRVDAALAALDAKTYGRHPETGELIDDALLAADPTWLS